MKEASFISKKFITMGAILATFLVNIQAQEFSSEKVYIRMVQETKPTDQGVGVTGSGVSILDFQEGQATYYALIIGINNYPDPAIASLDYPIQDARKLHRVLWENYLFEEENIQLLENPSRSNIIYALDHLARAVRPDDNVLIFYAGHGLWDENSHIGYWLPSDSRRISKADWFRNSTLVDYLKEINSKHTLLITDACFGGSIFKTRKAFEDAPKDLEILYEYPSRKAMTSGALTEVPDESVFSKYLIERLEKNEDKFLSSEQLFSTLRVAVENNSEVTPQFGEIRNVGDQGGDFIFIKK